MPRIRRTPTRVWVAYDGAGNMREQALSEKVEYVYTHDAWNRLVKVEIREIESSAAVALSESEYNGLHWRSVHRRATGVPATGLDEESVYTYSAGWQLLQADIDEKYTASPGIDRRVQRFWGTRYIDEAVAWRADTGEGGVGSTRRCTAS